MTNQIILSSINPTPFLKAAHGEPLHSSSCFRTYTLYVGLESVPEYPSTNLYVLVPPINPYSRMSRQSLNFQAMSAKDMYPIPQTMASRSRPAGVGDLRVLLLEQWRKCFSSVSIYIYLYIYILTIYTRYLCKFPAPMAWVLCKCFFLRHFVSHICTSKPLRKSMHSPPSRWFVLPASVIWAGHVARRWDEKKQTFFWGGGWGGGVFRCFVLGWLDFLFFCFCLIWVVESLNVFFGGVQWNDALDLKSSYKIDGVFRCQNPAVWSYLWQFLARCEKCFFGSLNPMNSPKINIHPKVNFHVCVYPKWSFLKPNWIILNRSQLVFLVFRNEVSMHITTN